jgi:hypothetical protein
MFHISFKGLAPQENGFIFANLTSWEGFAPGFVHVVHVFLKTSFDPAQRLWNTVSLYMRCETCYTLSTLNSLRMWQQRSTYFTPPKVNWGI